MQFKQLWSTIIYLMDIAKKLLFTELRLRFILYCNLMWSVCWNGFSFDSYVTSTTRVAYKHTYMTSFKIICYSCIKTTKNSNKLKLLITFHGNSFTNISHENLNYSSNRWSEGQTCGVLIGFRRFAITSRIISYVHQCCLGNRNKFPSC
jgi:hypothetical protein